MSDADEGAIWPIKDPDPDIYDAEDDPGEEDEEDDA
jgi:hypothetical protein